jgi:hypothetical protein
MSEIYAALAAVMADCDHVAKRDRNDHQKFMFRGIDAVVNAVGPVLRKHGVIVAPNVEQVTYDTVQTSTGKPARACRVLVTYTFYAKDGSTIDVRVAGEAWDNGDKAAPKAMSVAFRTALLQALALPTDEADPDAQNYVRDNAPPMARRSAPSGPQWSDEPPDLRHPGDKPITTKTRGQLFALFAQKGVAEDQQLSGVNHINGTAHTSRSQITESEANAVIAVLKQRPDVDVPMVAPDGAA